MGPQPCQIWQFLKEEFWSVCHVSSKATTQLSCGSLGNEDIFLPFYALLFTVFVKMETSPANKSAGVNGGSRWNDSNSCCIMADTQSSRRASAAILKQTDAFHMQRNDIMCEN